MPEQPDADVPDAADAPEASDAPDAPDASDAPDAPVGGRPEPDWKRRRRLAAVFGDAMPDITSDEREPGAGSEASDGTGETAGDRWLRSQVPPHHG